MSLREWFILTGIIIIAAVLIGGILRMRLNKKRASELQFGLEEVKGYDDDYNSELPGGGARRIKRNYHEGTGHSRKEPGLSSLGMHDIPDTEENGVSFFNLKEFGAQEDNLYGQEGKPANVVEKDREDRLADIEQSVAKFMKEPDGESIHYSTGTKYPAGKQKKQKRNHRETLVDKPSGATASQCADDTLAEKLSDRTETDEVIVINVIARADGRFQGKDLLRSLLDADMRFGDMSIFHRYANVNGTGKIQFSMANGVQPGNFDLDTMDMMETPAVSFFMGLPGPRDPMKAFTLMNETARKIALDFGGELKDENQSVLTAQTIEHYRQRIQDYERKHLLNRLVD